MQKRRRMWGWVFVAPQFIGLLIFALIPLVMSFVISFHDWGGIADTMKFVGQIAGLVKEELSCKDLIDKLVKETDALLKGTGIYE